MLCESFVLEEDNDPAHRTTYKASEDNDIKELRKSRYLDYNPLNCFDLSVVGNVWHILKQRVKRREPRDLKSFMRII